MLNEIALAWSALGEKGKALVPLIEAMRGYGKRWLSDEARLADQAAREQTGAEKTPVVA